MCYPKPGPRCSAHARKELHLARLNKNQEEGSFESEMRLAKAQQDFDQTPAGMTFLRKRINAHQNVSPESAHLFIDHEAIKRLEDAVNNREAALKAIGSKDLGDVFTQSKRDYRTKTFLLSKVKKFPSDQTPRTEATVQQKARHIEMSAEWVDRLTPEEIKAFDWFSEDGCTDLQRLQNGTLEAQGDETLEETKTRVAAMGVHLDEALAKVTPRTKIVYRGAKLHTLPGITADMTREEQYAKQDEALKALQTKGVIEFPRPISATFNPQRANMFARQNSSQGGFIFEILTRKGAPAALASNMPVEEEVLIPGKQKYRVIAVKEVPMKFRGDKDGEVTMRTVVQLEEM